MPPVNFVVEESTGSEAETIVKLEIHHVLYDGISLPILISELQALYQNREVSTPQTKSFKHFVAQSIAASSTSKEKWMNYLSNSDETLFSAQEKINDPKTSRTEIYHPSNPISDLKAKAQQAGVSIDALFLAGLAKILATTISQSLECGSKDKPDQVIFGIYLSNRAPFGSDLSSLSAPTLNLLPLRVDRPSARSIEKIASDIQRDLNVIGSKEMVGASLAEIYEWTSVRVDCFVNILRSANPGSHGQISGGAEEWQAVQDLGKRAEVVEEVVNGDMNEVEDGKCDAYLVRCYFYL